MGLRQGFDQVGIRIDTELDSGVPTRSLYRAAKRALDVVGACAGLVVTAPLLAAIGLAIKLDSPGPILFRQERIGEGGRPFVLLKFRSMYADTDDRLHREAIRRFRAGEVIADSGEAHDPYKLMSDPRVTRVGCWLRSSSLDELPQLLNVLKGDMSLVGPRPALAYELALYEHHHLRRLEAPQGLTGLWQVYGRGRVAFEGSMALDLQYVEDCSFWLDLKLLALTIPAVLSRRGAH
jgi:lipopolysaccharide/colanic/teichoic acid biosynthesis glycosyltransferase